MYNISLSLSQAIFTDIQHIKSWLQKEYYSISYLLFLIVKHVIFYQLLQ
jgi:hypothetical protein